MPHPSLVMSEGQIFLPHTYQVHSKPRLSPGCTRHESRCLQALRRKFGLDPDAMLVGFIASAQRLEMEVIRAWAGALRRAPRAHLALPEMDAARRGALVRLLGACGVAASRLVWLAPLSRPEYIERAAALDLALDSRQYNSHSTGAETLWGATPVLTLAGERFEARVGASLVRAAVPPSMPRTRAAVASVLVQYSLRGVEAAAARLMTSQRALDVLRAALLQASFAAPLHGSAATVHAIESGLRAASDVRRTQLSLVQQHHHQHQQQSMGGNGSVQAEAAHASIPAAAGCARLAQCAPRQDPSFVLRPAPTAEALGWVPWHIVVRPSWRHDSHESARLAQDTLRAQVQITLRAAVAAIAGPEAVMGNVSPGSPIRHPNWSAREGLHQAAGMLAALVGGLEQRWSTGASHPSSFALGGAEHALQRLELVLLDLAQVMRGAAFAAREAVWMDRLVSVATPAGPGLQRMRDALSGRGDEAATLTLALVGERGAPRRGGKRGDEAACLCGGAHVRRGGGETNATARVAQVEPGAPLWDADDGSWRAMRRMYPPAVRRHIEALRTTGTASSADAGALFVATRAALVHFAQARSAQCAVSLEAMERHMPAILASAARAAPSRSQRVWVLLPPRRNASAPLDLSALVGSMHASPARDALRQAMHGTAGSAQTACECSGLPRCQVVAGHPDVGVAVLGGWTHQVLAAAAVRAVCGRGAVDVHSAASVCPQAGPLEQAVVRVLLGSAISWAADDGGGPVAVVDEAGAWRALVGHSSARLGAVQRQLAQQCSCARRCAAELGTPAGPV